VSIYCLIYLQILISLGVPRGPGVHKWRVLMDNWSIKKECICHQSSTYCQCQINVHSSIEYLEETVGTGSKEVHIYINVHMYT
jgi:hypothetical protein